MFRRLVCTTLALILLAGLSLPAYAYDATPGDDMPNPRALDYQPSIQYVGPCAGEICQQHNLGLLIVGWAPENSDDELFFRIVEFYLIEDGQLSEHPFIVLVTKDPKDKNTRFDLYLSYDQDGTISETMLDQPTDFELVFNDVLVHMFPPIDDSNPERERN